MILLIIAGIDEFTIVLQSRVEIMNIEDWQDIAQMLIDEFISLSLLEDVLDTTFSTDNNKSNPAGYTSAIHVTNKPYYLSIAYHEFYVNMGVIVKFSAWAWAEYQANYLKKYSVNITLSKFLNMINSSIYDFRLSRVDVAIDYKNYFEDNFLDVLNDDIASEKIKVVNENNIKSFHSSSSIKTNNKISSIYLGSKKANTRVFMRIYNKKKEQIEKNGFRLSEAKKCDSWIRFEASFRTVYAHKITEELIKTNDYIKSLINIFLNKYRFFDVQNDKYCDYTEDLIQLLENPSQNILRCESPRDNSISQSIRYLILDSGLFTTFVKVFLLWGDEAEKKLLSFLREAYKAQKKDILNKREIIAFVKKHSDLKNTDFSNYLSTIL